MYCRWKVLITFGFTFWLASYISDIYFLDPRSKAITEAEDRNFFTMEDAIEMPEEKIDESPWFVLFWSLAAFAFTLVTCFAIKIINTRVSYKYLRSLMNLGMHLRASKSKIPILVSKPVNENIDYLEADRQMTANYYQAAPQTEDFGTVTTSINTQTQGTNTADLLKHTNSTERDKIIKTARHMEKHYSKLREELMTEKLALQKEQQYMQKKIEMLVKEKRESSKQVSVAQKENKVAKQQIEELLAEKTGISKRLDSASKEIRNNTKNKKLTLEKLEEALGAIDRLKKKLEQVSRDKEIIENKFSILEVEYKQMQEKLDAHLNGMQLMKNNVVNEEPERDKNTLENRDCGDSLSWKDFCESFENTEDNDIDISQSEKDMKKVQLKLMNLEQSLEKLRIKEYSSVYKDNLEDDNCDALQNQFEETKIEEPEVAETPSSESICVDSECPLEHSECTNSGCFQRGSFSLIDNASNEAVKEDTSDEDDVSSEFNNVTHSQAAKVINHVDNILEMSEDISKSLTDDSDTTTVDEDEEGVKMVREWEVKRGMVSDSPEFQRFMIRILEGNV